MSFLNIIGNSEAKKYLNKCIEENHILHSYLFLGTEGIGKLLIAKEFAKKILCLDDSKDECTCKSCICFNGKNHPDFYLINETGENIKIDIIRELTAKVIEKPIVSKRKVYIINDFEKMTTEAQNCLLKTLEEPPEYAMIILIVSNEKLMLPTIKSRCVIVKFGNISKEELIKKGVSEDEALLLDGSFRGIDTISEQIDSFRELEKLVDSLKNDELLKCFKNAKILYENQDNILRFLDYINIIAYNKKIINIVEVVETTKQKIIYNNNFNMTIDYFVMTAYEKLH